MDGGKYKQMMSLLKDLKQDYPDFDINLYRSDINGRVMGGGEISDITEEELLLITDLEQEDLDAED